MGATKRIFYLSAILAGIAASGFGQAVSGRIDGVIRDASGGVVAKAAVKAINEDTAARTEVVTNDSGQYVFPNLLPGPYAVTAEFAGFKRVEVKGVVLRIGDARRLDFTLAPGVVTDSVEVAAEATTVDTATARIGAVVENRQAVDLPLNGRDAMMLFYLQAGTNPMDRFGSLQQTGSVDGLAPGTSQIKVEGVLAINPGYDYAPSHPSMPVPQEAVGEYRVSTSSDLADAGKGSGAQVKVLLRSGTNEFHGSAFEFNRNTAYNANDFFNNRTAVARPVLLRNQFGFALGGPVIRNKTFFFVTAEGQKQTQQSVQNKLVYTQPLRSGIFRYNIGGTNSSALVDTHGNLLVPASQIGNINLVTADPTRLGFDNVFLPKILSVMPPPNNNDLGDGLNTAGYRYNAWVPDSYYQFLAKVDHNLSNKHHIVAAISDYHEDNPQPQQYNGISLEGFIEDRQGVSLRVVSTFSPTFMNEFSIGANLRKAQRPNTNPSQQTPSGNFQLTGLGSGNINSTRSNQINPAFNEGFQDNATKVYGNHTISFGGEFWHQTLNRKTQANEYPVVSTASSGNAATLPSVPGLSSTDRSLAQQLTNDLTGAIGSISQTFWLNSPTGFVPYMNLYQAMRKTEWGFFAQDIWKVRPNFSVILGLRYDVMPPVTINNVYAYPIGGYAGALGVQGPTGKPTQWGPLSDHGASVFHTDYNNLAPNIGIVWDPFGDGKTAIRSAYRISYDRSMIVSGDFSSTNYGTSTSVTLQPSPSIRFSQLDQVLPIAAPGVFPQLGNIRQGAAYVADPNLAAPYVQQWSFGVEREVRPGWKVSASYVGNHAVGVWNGTNLNQVNITTNGFLDAFNIAQRNLAANGNPTTGQSLGALQPLFKLIPSSQYNLITQSQAASLANYLDTNTLNTGVRGGLLTQAGLPATFFRYNPQIQDLYVVGNWGQSTWDGVKLELLRHFAHGTYLQANYTISKGFANESPDNQLFTSPYRDANNHRLDKGLSPLDATHVVILNGVWELPFGHGKPLLNSARGWLQQVAGGWQLNGIYNFSTGRPISVVTGRYMLNQSVASTANFSGGFSNLSSVNKGGNQVTFISPAQASAFSNPAAGQPGGLPSYAFHSPGFSTLDASLFKAFSLNPLREGMALQLRFEFFNVLNHTTFQAPGSTNINSGSFGVLSSAYPARIGQVAVKINF